MIKVATALLGGNLALTLLKFGRNVLVARLLSVEDFGVASTFAIIFGFIEMVGFLGLDRLLIQAHDGRDERFQATLQAIQVLRGALVALLLFAAAGPLAALMDVPEVAWGFRVMALIPLAQGFMHLDMARAQREMRFGPFVKANLWAEALGLALVWPLFLVFGDYRIALFALLAQQLLTVVFSHLLAERSWRLAFDRAIALRALRFAWPLLLNALLMFAILQGDRIIVANRLGAAELGVFSLAFMLTFMPAAVLTQTVSRLLLPKLARLQDDPAAFARLARVVMEAGLAVGLALAVGFCLFGADLVLIVFGHKYDGALAILPWLAVMQAVRAARTGVSLVALARGETMSPMVANAPRVMLLPLAWLALSWGGGAPAVVAIATTGEAMGLGVGLFLLRRWLRVPLRGLILPFALWACVLVLIMAYATLMTPRAVIFGNFHWPQIVIALCGLGAALLGMRETRTWVAARLRTLP